jgi:hypothetical protein
VKRRSWAQRPAPTALGSLDAPGRQGEPQRRRAPVPARARLSGTRGRNQRDGDRKSRWLSIPLPRSLPLAGAENCRPRWLRMEPRTRADAGCSGLARSARRRQPG